MTDVRTHDGFPDSLFHLLFEIAGLRQDAVALGAKCLRGAFQVTVEGPAFVVVGQLALLHATELLAEQ